MGGLATRAGGRAGGKTRRLFRDKCGPPDLARFLADPPLDCHSALGRPAKRQHNQSKQAV